MTGEQSENQTRPGNKEKLHTRRDILTGAAIAGAGLLAVNRFQVANNLIQIFDAQDKKAPPPRIEVEREIVSWIEDKQAPWPTSIKVGVDAEGIPVKSILPDGTEVGINGVEARRVRELAKQTHEPEMVQILQFPAKEELGSDIEIDDKFFEPTREHPLVEQIPDDVLSNEELAKRGINIINTNKVNLSIRKSEFEEGGSLHNFRGSHNMTLILVDGAVVVEELLEDEKLKPYKKLLWGRDSEIKEFRKKRIKETQESIEQTRIPYHAYYEKYLAGDLDFSTFYESLLLNAKAGPKVWQDHITDGEVYMYMRSYGETQGDAAGLYTVDKAFFKKDTSVLFVAAGSTHFKSDLTYMFYDHEDRLQIHTLTPGVREVADYTESRTGGSRDYTPTLSQTHPNPNSFHLNAEASRTGPRYYPYGGQTIGLTIRHELAHEEMIGSSHPGRVNRNEYDTDMRAMQGIERAWKRWENSDYMDNSGFGFVLRTENGIILT